MIRVLLVLMALVSCASAATHTAASATRAAVQAAYDLCANGDTLEIPAGTITDWTTTLEVTKGIHIVGAGQGVTVIQDSVVKLTGQPVRFEAVFFFSVSEPNSASLKDLSIVAGARSTNYGNGAIQISGTCKTYVFQRITTTNLNNSHYHTYPGAACYGVISNVTATTDTNLHLFRWYHGGHNGPSGPRSNGNGAWESPRNAGTDKFWYVESSTLNNEGYKACDGFSGSRYVMRYNTTNERGFGHHGTESTQIHRSPYFAEIYGNTITRAAASFAAETYDMRDGNAYFWGNTITGSYTRMVKLNSYRVFFRFKPWGTADGTMLWDENDATDTGTGDDNTAAGDGIFCSGTTTAGSGLLLLEDTGKSWSTANQWYGYTARWLKTFTASSGTATTITVSPDPGWTPGQWGGYSVTKKTTNEKGSVSNNTTDTITLSSEYYRPNFTGYTGDFELSNACVITSSGTSTLAINNQGGFGTNYTVPSGFNYEIRKLIRTLDQTGRGQCDPISSQSTSGLNHQDLNHAEEPSYFWLNNFKGDTAPLVGNYYNLIIPDRDYFYHVSGYDGSTGMGSGPIASRPASPTKAGTAWWATDQGEWNSTNGATPDGQLYVWNGTQWNLHYVPYTFPHPLRDDAAGDSTDPQLSSATIDENGTSLSLIFTEAVTGVDASDFAMSGGLSLSAATGGGLTWTMTIAPAATYSTSYTLGYTAGDTEDLAGNALGNFSGTAVTNNTANPDDADPAILSATIDASGTTLTIVFTEVVTGVVLGDYSLSGGLSLSNLAGSGDTRTFDVSPAASFGVSYSMDYVPGTTEDTTGNLMAAINDGYVTNLREDEAPSVRNPGRNRVKRLLPSLR